VRPKCDPAYGVAFTTFLNGRAREGEALAEMHTFGNERKRSCRVSHLGMESNDELEFATVDRVAVAAT
jgi:hypothetical protein